jgi:hypothetical protein
MKTYNKRILEVQEPFVNNRTFADSVGNRSSTIECLPTASGAVRQRSNACRQRWEPFVNDRTLADSVGNRSSTIE